MSEGVTTLATRGGRPLRIFLVAGEHSGDALGAKLMAALKRDLGDTVVFSGVGGPEMAHEGLASLFPIEDVAVMGPMHILPALPRIVRRVYQAMGAALAFRPDCVVIIDSPEFTHPIAKRIRKRAPHIPIIDYVCPSVWAWRPGRAAKMARHIDEVACLLPFEPEALQRLKGPHGTYVGHPLIERLDEIRSADADGLRARLGIAGDAEVLAVLPGSRRSEVDRLLGVFGETIARLKAQGRAFECIVPAVAHVREKIEAASGTWTARTHVVSAGDKYAALRMSRAALAASGTVTLELALAGLPMVVAYKVDDLTAAVVKRLITTDTAILANLVLGTERPFPQFIQENCTAEKLSAAVSEILDQTPARAVQLEALSRIPDKLLLAHGTPSERAAEVVIDIARR